MSKEYIILQKELPVRSRAQEQRDRKLSLRAKRSNPREIASGFALATTLQAGSPLTLRVLAMTGKTGNCKSYLCSWTEQEN